MTEELRRHELVETRVETMGIFRMGSNVVHTLIATDVSECLDDRRNLDVQARERLKAGEFLAVLAHELRNPIGAIQSAVRVLDQNPQQDETMTRAREVITRQVGHLTHLIEDLFDAERIAFGKIRLDCRLIDFAVAVYSAVVSYIVDVALA